MIRDVYPPSAKLHMQRDRMPGWVSTLVLAVGAIVGIGAMVAVVLFVFAAVTTGGR